jgi:sigma-B regulation protein RsbU (phosphoserine phosphatase)
LKNSADRISSRLSRSGALPISVIAAAWLFLALGAPGIPAQTFDASNVRDPTDLAATWLVRAGDDPAYARPDFDDSDWMKFDSTKDLRDLFPKSHPAIVWYRLHVKVAPTQTGLALKEWQISRAFEIYTNGALLMRLGRVKPLVEYTYGAPRLTPIPEQQIATGSLVIALRVHIPPSEWSQSRPGFDAENLTLGREHELWQDIWLTTIGAEAASAVNTLLFVGLGVLALALFFAQRRQKEYLWLALQSLLNGLMFIFNAGLGNHPRVWDLGKGLDRALIEVFGFLTYAAFLQLRLGWRTKTYLALATLLMIAGSIPGTVDPDLAFWAFSVPLYFVTDTVIPILLVLHFRRGNREAGILLVPSLLWSLSWYTVLASAFLTHIPTLADPVIRLSLALTYYKVGPFVFRLWDFNSVLYMLSFAIIIVVRTGRMSRQQTLLEGEVAAAREVQQVILPEQIESVPGFAVESVYQPAQQVGGDFFQVLPAGDGGLLVIVGDVAGKGLPAAMLVSVLVGSIRTAAENTHDPAALLCKLNDRLLGRTRGGFSTALAAYIAADGIVTIANAGHLSPYLDGREVELPGALPLGIDKGASYESTRFNLTPGSRLTFYSDGIVEAQNPRGELFGFDRAKAISTQRAAAIAEAAKQFGQSDDITVVTIERLATAKEHGLFTTARVLSPG